MSKFVRFSARGFIYYRDDNGRPNGVKRCSYGSGITLSDNELMGKVFMQCPDLLPCDRVDVETCPIG